MVQNSQHNYEERKRKINRKVKNNTISRRRFPDSNEFFFNERMVGLIETNDRISKGNYGSRKGYSIDYLTLEKRLLYDCSMQNME